MEDSCHHKNSKITISHNDAELVPTVHFLTHTVDYNFAVHSVMYFIYALG